MRLFFRSLVFLDFVALVFLSMQLWYIRFHFSEFQNDPVEKIKAILMFPMYLLVLIGAIGLFFRKKYGYILYYIQFPFRLYLAVFTVGFITLLPETFGEFGDQWRGPLIKICFAAETIRLYLTIKAHMKSAN